AANQYLGIANRAYVIRGAVDYSQLIPRTTAPRGEAMGGTYWLDTRSTVFGVFESNGGPVPGSAWGSRQVLVVDPPSEIDSIILGTVSFVDPNADVVVNNPGTLVINGNMISIGANATLQNIVTAINFASIPGVTALAFRLGVMIRLLDRNSSAVVFSIGNTSHPDILTGLGLTSPGDAFIVPKATIGLDGDFAV
ncbi:hypothetical protein, partial [Escherichia coli]|uniref:hypothetical protein n=1 Tax=Escherichia coli TaxID=562 RepID=UPI0013B3D161